MFSSIFTFLLGGLPEPPDPGSGWTVTTWEPDVPGEDEVADGGKPGTGGGGGGRTIGVPLTAAAAAVPDELELAPWLAPDLLFLLS
jgi:hypothetical protein